MFRLFSLPSTTRGAKNEQQGFYTEYDLKVEILCITSPDLAIMLPRDTFAAEKANRVSRGIKRGLEEEQWNEPSYGNALLYLSPKMTGSYCVVRKCQPRVSPGRLMRLRKLLAQQRPH